MANDKFNLATELVAKLRAYHNFAQSKPDKQHLKYFGLDLVNGTVSDPNNFVFNL